METVILHSCCAPCSAAVLEWMLAHDIRPIVFYFNPNIFPQAEYEKRKAELTVHCQRLGVEVVDGDWDHNTWLEAVKGLENEPEKGRRCDKCFELRLLKTAQLAKKSGINEFTTSIVISPHKNFQKLTEIGEKIAKDYNLLYKAIDFKKKDGFLKTNKIAKELNLYRQNYCGCEFSKYL